MPAQNVTFVGLVKFSIRSPNKTLREIAGAIGVAASANLKAAFRETEAFQDEIVIRIPAELGGDLVWDAHRIVSGAAVAANDFSRDAANATAAAAAVQAAEATDSRTAELANHAVGLLRLERNARGADRHAKSSTAS